MHGCSVLYTSCPKITEYHRNTLILFNKINGIYLLENSWLKTEKSDPIEECLLKKDILWIFYGKLSPFHCMENESLLIISFSFLIRKVKRTGLKQHG